MKRCKKYIVLFVLAQLAMCIAVAQVKNIGKVISYKKVPGGIEGKTAAAIFDVHVYNDHIIRVRISKNKQFSNFSYALTDNISSAIHIQW